MNDKTQVQIVNDEINRELADPRTTSALLATTFQGLDAVTMKQAILEGMIRGFTFTNFLKKDVYALPFNSEKGKKYSLITSIDYARKIAQKAGQCGKSKPIYTFAENGKDILTCEVTVQKLVSGHVGDYTAEVYFNEYDKKQNLWISKPKTMIAKVAEMHALRSAFPEELDKVYVEEEIGKVSRVNEVNEVDRSNLTMVDITPKNESKKNKKDEDKDEEFPSPFGNTDNEN
jgi:hypothetical protein